MKFVDVSFYYNRDETDGKAIIHRHRTNLEYVRYLPTGCQCSVIKFMDAETHFSADNIDYYFFKGVGAGIYPHTAISRLKALDPDMVLIHGFIYSWQVFLVRKALGKKVKIVLQHHGEIVPGGWRKWLMKKADDHVDGYFFTARTIADNWIREGIISDESKVLEVLTGSSALDVPVSRASSFKLKGTPTLLWVGRLDHNKDPLTVIEAFALFLKDAPEARLYIIYQSEVIPGALQQMLDEDELLSAAITLVGTVKYDDLINWYLAADIFISGSKREACGYALLEAMHCGCIPVVTDIPAFRKVTADGRVGYLFEPGNAESCLQALSIALTSDRQSMKEKVIRHFENNLSFEAIAKQVGLGFLAL